MQESANPWPIFDYVLCPECRNSLAVYYRGNKSCEACQNSQRRPIPFTEIMDIQGKYPASTPSVTISNLSKTTYPMVKNG